MTQEELNKLLEDTRLELWRLDIPSNQCGAAKIRKIKKNATKFLHNAENALSSGKVRLAYEHLASARTIMEIQ